VKEKGDIRDNKVLAATITKKKKKTERYKKRGRVE